MTGQNRSSAVMQQRREPPDSLDYFPTPPWATRALLTHVIPYADGVCWEPACGEGHMARPLAEHFPRVLASDIFDYGFGEVRDFLAGPGQLLQEPDPACDWIITNPPFKCGDDFILRALSVARRGVAMIVRTAFTEGVERYNRLWLPHPPYVVAQFVERVVILKGRLAQPDEGTATAYCWIVWDRLADRAPYTWIPPCRKALERPEDYRQ